MTDSFVPSVHFESWFPVFILIQFVEDFNQNNEDIYLINWYLNQEIATPRFFFRHFFFFSVKIKNQKQTKQNLKKTNKINLSMIVKVVRSSILDTSECVGKNSLWSWIVNHLLLLDYLMIFFLSCFIWMTYSLRVSTPDIVGRD